MVIAELPRTADTSSALQAIDTHPPAEFNFDYREKELREVIEQSVEVLLRSQHESGFFPAATKELNYKEAHYGECTWLRDANAVGSALINPQFQLLYEGTNTGALASLAATRLAKAELRKFAEPEYQEAFNQSIGLSRTWAEETFGYPGHTYLTKPAPRQHFKVDGEVCKDFNSQNQIDAMGSSLTFLARVQMGGVKFTEKEQETYEAVASYVLRTEPWRFATDSMWEMGECFDPTPLSSIAYAAQGMVYASHVVRSPELKQKLLEAAKKSYDVILEQYPREHTVPDGHMSEVDLATLIAKADGAIPLVDPAKDGKAVPIYSAIADVQLGDGQHPGMLRYIGDSYFNDARWGLGYLSKSQVYGAEALEQVRAGNYEEARVLWEKDMGYLQQGIAIKDMYGFSPELLEKGEDGNYRLPPEDRQNNLLWNYAKFIESASMAIFVKQFI